MKKLIFICCTLLLSLQAYTQSNAGFYGGLNYSNVTMESPTISSDSRTGYQLGAYVRSGNILYGQLGLEYVTTQSYLTINDSTDISNAGNVRWHMLNVPVYAGLNLIPVADRLVNVRIYAGPNLSLILDVPVNDVTFAQEDFAKVRVDATVGAGFDLLFFSLDAGYNFGLSNVFSDNYNGKAHYAFVNLGIKL